MESLPKEVLVSIFKHLPQSDLLSLTRVNKRFSETIDQFDLIEHLYIGNQNDESSTPNRKYSKATVRNYKPDVHQKVFESIGSQLKTLKFFLCNTDLKTIASILQLTPNIKFLTFDYVRLDDDSIDENALLPLLQDVNLLINESDPKVFRLLQQSSFVKVDLRFYGDFPYSNFVELVQVFKQQKKLTSFAISGVYESNLFLIPMGAANYQLKEFSIDNCDLEEWEHLENFLMQHVGSLEKFDVKNVRWDPSIILNNCAKLKSLEAQRIDMENMEVRSSIEKLSMEPPINDMDKFPNVKRLFIGRSSPVSNQMITNSMKKLEDIEVKFGDIAGLDIPLLKKLKLSSIDGVIDANFFRIHIKIDDLTLENNFNIDDSLLESINLANLKVLRILGDNHLTSRAFTIIRENCKSLKVFEMTKWDQKFKKEDWTCLYEIAGLEIYIETF